MDAVWRWHCAEWVRHPDGSRAWRKHNGVRLRERDKGTLDLSGITRPRAGDLFGSGRTAGLNEVLVDADSDSIMKRLVMSGHR
jgi:hypothetical protein